MRDAAKRTDRSMFYAFLFVAGAICVGIAPSGFYGYVVPVIASFVITAIFYSTFSSRSSFDKIVVLSVILLFPFLNSLAHSSEYDKPLWAMRDFARFIFLAILVFDLSALDYRKVQYFFGWGLLFILGFDFVILYHGASEAMRLTWLEMAANNLFQEYVGDYYRHLGIMGNPNASAAFYGMTIFVLIFFEAVPAKVRLLGLALAVLLLFESQSRSYLIATILSVALGLTAIRISRVAVLVAGVTLALYLSLDLQKSVEIFWDRTEELSAFEERGELVWALIADIDLVKLLVGDPLLPTVVDNDVVFFFLRFGLPVMIFLMSVVWRVMPSDLRLARTRLIYAFAGFGVVGSLAGGIFGHPGLAFLYVCVFRVFTLIPVTERPVEQLEHAPVAHHAGR